MRRPFVVNYPLDLISLTRYCVIPPGGESYPEGSVNQSEGWNCRDVVIILDGTPITLPKQPSKGGVGGNPIISVQLDAEQWHQDQWPIRSDSNTQWPFCLLFSGGHN